jgi:uncharacterized repeat protein (TIGR01451 family)
MIKRKKNLIFTVLILTLFVLSAFSAIGTNKAQALATVYCRLKRPMGELPETANEEKVLPGQSARFGFEAACCYHSTRSRMEITIEDIKIENDDPTKYDMSKNGIFLRPAKASNLLHKDSQVLLTGQFGDHGTDFVLCIETPTNASVGATITLSVYMNLINFPNEYKPFREKVTDITVIIKNNDVWPGSWYTFGTIKDDSPLIPGVDGYYLQFVRVPPGFGLILRNPFSMTSWDPFNTFYFWFNSQYKLSCRIPLNVKLNENLKIDIIKPVDSFKIIDATQWDLETIRIDIKEPSKKINLPLLDTARGSSVPVKDKRSTMTSGCNLAYAYFICDEPYKEAIPGESVTYNLTALLDYAKFKDPKVYSKSSEDYEVTLENMWLDDREIGKVHITLPEDIKTKQLRTIVQVNWSKYSGCLSKLWVLLVTKVNVADVDINVIKEANVTEGFVGDLVNYTITVSNTGSDSLNDVYVNDTTLGMSYYLDTLAGGASKVYYIEHILAENPDPFINQVMVEGYDEFGKYYSDVSQTEIDVKNPCEDPILEFDPSSYNFGDMNGGEIDSFEFDIWNKGNDTLTYSLSEDCSWLEISPNNGNSSGEHDLIAVDINTTGLSQGLHSSEIQITSNGGIGVFIASVNIKNDPIPNEPPIIEITKPIGQKLYFKDKELITIRRNITIGPLTISAEATDEDGTIERVELYIDGQEKFNTTDDEFEYLWNERAFGKRIIKVIAYDDYGLNNEKEMEIIIINFNR